MTVGAYLEYQRQTDDLAQVILKKMFLVIILHNLIAKQTIFENTFTIPRYIVDQDHYE